MDMASAVLLLYSLGLGLDFRCVGVLGPGNLVTWATHDIIHQSINIKTSDCVARCVAAPVSPRVFVLLIFHAYTCLSLHLHTSLSLIFNLPTSAVPKMKL